MPNLRKGLNRRVLNLRQIEDIKRLKAWNLENMDEEEREMLDDLSDELYQTRHSAETSERDKERMDVPRICTGANFCSADFFEFLERRMNRKKKDRPFRKEKRVIVNKLFEVIRDEFINRSAGVVLEGIGYMCVWVTPRKVRMRDYSKGGKPFSKFMHETNGYFYNLALFPEIFNSGLTTRGWIMERTFRKPLKRAVFFNVAAGKKYYFHYKAVRSMYDSAYAKRLMNAAF